MSEDPVVIDAVLAYKNSTATVASILLEYGEAALQNYVSSLPYQLDKQAYYESLASTLPQPGTVGNFLVSDGTHWTSAPSPGGPESDPYFHSWLAATPPLYAEADTLATVTGRGASATTGITVDLGAQGAASPPAAAYNATNSTASTSGVPEQNSPAYTWTGTGWNGTSSDTYVWGVWVVPSSTVAQWKLGVSKNGGGWTFPLVADTYGSITTPYLTVTSNFSSAGATWSRNLSTPTFPGQTRNVGAMNGSPVDGDVLVIDTSVNNTFRKALTTDTTAAVVGVKSTYAGSTYAAVDQQYIVNCDAAAVNRGDTLVVSTATAGAAMANNAESNPKHIVGYALSAKAAGSIGTVSVWLK